MNQNDIDRFSSQIRGFLDCSRPCQKLFDEAVIHGLSAQRTKKTLFSDITITNKLFVLENAINVVQDSCDLGTCGHTNLRVLSVPILFKYLRRLTQADNSKSEPKPIQGSIQPKTTPVNPGVSKVSKPIQTPLVVKLPEGKDADLIYDQVHEKLIGGRPFQRCKFVTCMTVGCKFCRDLFSNVTLTPCQGHKPCVPGGWYPHIGASLWKQLVRKHDSGTEYVCKARNRIGGMPALSSAKSLPSSEPEHEPVSVSEKDIQVAPVGGTSEVTSMDFINVSDALDKESWADGTPLVTNDQVHIQNLTSQVELLKIQLAERDQLKKMGLKIKRRTSKLHSNSKKIARIQ